MSAVVTAEAGQVVTVRDALVELLRISAAREVLANHEADVKSFLRTEADRVEAETGTAANFNAKSVGRAYVTQPSLKPQIVDRAKVENLARLAEVGVDRAQIDTAALQHDLDSGRLADTDLLAALEASGYVTTERVLPEAWLDELVAECVVREDGELVHASTGEVVEGVRMVATSRPTLTFKAEPAAKKQVVQQLTRHVAAIGGQ